jgi:ribosomal-protein-alanine N-acetyltransferase
MSHETTLYDAFTGMNTAEKSAVIHFLCEYTEDAEKQSVREAVEYAIKHKPSFGGFILTVHQCRQIIAAVVVNRTGMEGYNPHNLFVYVTVHKDFRHDEAMMQYLLKRAIDHADGDIALHVPPGHPALKLYRKMGFKSQLLELRLHKSAPRAIA